MPLVHPPDALTPFKGLGRMIDDRAAVALRDYQVGAVNRVKAMFAEGYRRLLGVMSMGAGKTICFAKLAEFEWAERGRRTLILVDQDELVRQAVDKVRMATGHLADIEKGKVMASKHAPIVVSTIQTMHRRLDRWPADHFGLVVADECDRSVAETWQRTLTHFDQHANVLGVTATQNRADRRDIMDYYQAKAFDIPLFDLIREGWLSRIKVRTVPLKIDIRDVSQTNGDYDAAELAAKLEPYFGEICEAIKAYAADRKILIFWPLIRTSKAFVGAALDRGLNFRHIDGKSIDRVSLQQGYREGRFQGLSNAQLLGRGWDEPSVNCVINCRATRHPSTYQQIMGRGVRPFEGKDNCLLLDFLWQFERFGVVRPADLIAKDDDQARRLTGELEKDGERDLEDADSQVAAEHERNLIAAFDSKKKRKGTVFDALEWAATMDVRALIDWRPETALDLKPVTEKQAAVLERAGFLLETVSGFGHAHAIISVIFDRMNRGLATFKQVHWLRKFGHHDAMNIPFAEASKLLDRYFNKGKA
jgi:superfamily II DNA or RNA helicase